MALPLANTFETAIADGTTITTTNSDDGTAGNAFDGIDIASGAAVIFSTTQAMHGTRSVRITQAATPGQSGVKWNTVMGVQTNWYGRVYCRWPALPPSGRHVFLQFWSISGGAFRGDLSLHTDGKIYVEDSASGTTASTTTLSVNTWYRVEWHWIAGTASNGSLLVKLYLGDSITLLETEFGRTAVTMGASADECAFIVSPEAPASFQVYFDSLQVNATAYPGPLTNPQLLRPSADSVVGAYLTQAGGTTNLYQTIDETIADDSDYVKSELAPATSIYRFKIGSGTDPVSSSGHTIRWRVGKLPSDGQQINATVRIYQGGGNSAGAGTLIKTATRTNVGAFTTYEEALSGGEADAITNYADLYGEIVAAIG